MLARRRDSRRAARTCRVPRAGWPSSGTCSLEPYSARRFFSFLHPNKNLLGSGYQLLQSRIGLGAGGVERPRPRAQPREVGAPAEPAHRLHLHDHRRGARPHRHVGGDRALRRLPLRRGAHRPACSNQVYRLIAVGITTWIAVEALINIASVVGWWAVTGVPVALLLLRRDGPHHRARGGRLLYNIAHDRSAQGDVDDPLNRPPRRTFDARPVARPTRTAPRPASRHRRSDARSSPDVLMAGPVVITGGGTGGHVFPMQAIAEALLDARGSRPSDLRFVGSRRGQEAHAASAATSRLTLLPGRGLRRSLAREATVATNLGAASRTRGGAGVAPGRSCGAGVRRSWFRSAATPRFAVVPRGRRWRRSRSCSSNSTQRPAPLSGSSRATPRCAAARSPRRGPERRRDGSAAARGDRGASIVRPRRARRRASRSSRRSSRPPGRGRHDGIAGLDSVNAAVRELARTLEQSPGPSRSCTSPAGATTRRCASARPRSRGSTTGVIEFGDMVELWSLARRRDLSRRRDHRRRADRPRDPLGPRALARRARATTRRRTRKRSTRLGGALLVRDDVLHRRRARDAPRGDHGSHDALDEMASGRAASATRAARAASPARSLSVCGPGVTFRTGNPGARRRRWRRGDERPARCCSLSSAPS